LLDTYALSLSPHTPPRHLHSFPTRRSSDLRHHADVAVITLVAGAGHGQLDQRHADIGLAAGSRGGEVFGQLCRIEALKAGQADRDRKSTRLNSSHVKISYAVFCLKKKKRIK